VRGLDVDGAYVADECLENALRLQAVEAVLEVDVIRRQDELRANPIPEVFGSGEVVGL
jgi:hypothetical protein